MKWRKPTLLEIEAMTLGVIIMIAIAQLIRNGLSYLAGFVP